MRGTDRGKRTGRLRDPSAWALLGANAWIIYLYLAEDWSSEMILLVYWSQSVIIGLFTFLRMVSLRRFDPGGITSNGVPVKATRRAQLGLSGFFLLHFYGFHLVYLLFIVSLFSRRESAPLRLDFLLGAAGIFFLNHLFSYVYHRWIAREESVPFGKLMFLPYLRIIPMHLCIIVGAFTGSFALIAFFTLLKTAADLGGHFLEHRGSTEERQERL